MPNTTNLGLQYPSSTDYVANGYLDIQTLAQDVDGYWGASTAYTPTFGNITSPVGNFTYVKMGKYLDVYGHFTGGTATAASSITVDLPAGETTVGRYQPVDAARESAGIGTLYAFIASNSATITIFGSATRGNFSAGASLTNLFFYAHLEVQ